MSEKAVTVKEVSLRRIQSLIDSSDQILKSASSPNEASYVDRSLHTAWRVRAILALEAILGSNHAYSTSFTQSVSEHSPQVRDTKAGKALLEAVYQDISEGYLTKLQTLISAEIFSDFMAMAQHLYDTGYTHPACSLGGAVLEDGLRKIATNNGVAVQAKDSLPSLNTKLAQAGVYNDIVREQIGVWTRIRNRADHGQFGEYKPEDVGAMLQGVRLFLASYLK